MKRIIFLLTVMMMVMGLGTALFAQVDLPEHHFVSGDWTIEGDRVYQKDATDTLAKANVRVHQSGPMLYDFNVRYETGGEDGHAGFGIHVFVDQVVDRRSWGNGKSYCLWLNYDENPQDKNIPKGLSGLVYRSVSRYEMTLVKSIDLNEYMQYLTPENVASPIPFRVWVNGDTGEVRVYDPTDPYMGTYYYFHIDKSELPLKGDWMVVRTNGVSLSFAPGL